MESQVWITGFGVVSAIGVGKEATLQALLTSRSGIGSVHHLETEHHEFPVGEVNLSNVQMMQMLNIPTDTLVNRTALLGMLALREALDDSHLLCNDLSHVSLVSGTTVGGMDMTELHYRDMVERQRPNDYIRIHDCGSTTELMADYFGRFQSVTTLSTACSSAANAVMLGANMLRAGVTECVIVGGSECLTRFHLNGFNSLMILAPDPCRPFDLDRAGLNLGEGAAYLVMEAAPHASARGINPIAVLSGYANACDAYHQTASSPDGEGAYRSMSAALSLAGINPSQVDYINAHGTGTRSNDLSESSAMRRLWGKQLPPISSTKGFTGHTTSASGGVEAAICLLAMQYSFIPPNLHHVTSDPECILPITTLRCKQTLNHVLCNSFGFGGNDTSLLFSLPNVGSTLSFVDGGIQAEIFAANIISNTLPEVKKYISPLEARRMGPLLKRALISSLQVLESSGLSSPDAIIMGTGWGCIENTLAILNSLNNEGERLLKPTHFMQSTHNTISSVVAQRINCHAYNATHSHNWFSLDSAFFDAFLQLSLGSIRTALVGEHDELPASSTSFVMGVSGALSVPPLCRIVAMRMLYDATSTELSATVDEMLRQSGCNDRKLATFMVCDAPRRYPSNFALSASALYTAVEWFSKNDGKGPLLLYNTCGQKGCTLILLQPAERTLQ